MAKKTEVKTAETVEVSSAIVELDESEMEGGLRVTVKDIQKRKEAARARIEVERAARAASPTGGRLTRLRVQADTIFATKFLHDYEKAIELYVHLWDGDDPCHKICEVHYRRDCRICKTSSTKYGENYPIAMRVFVGYVYNLIGQTFTKVDPRTGESKEYKLNPIKLIEVPLGKEDINVSTLQEAARRRYFLEDIWQLERKKGKGFQPPKTFKDVDEFRKMVGKDVPVEIPALALKINELNKLELFKFMLTAFDDVDWEALKLKPPTAKAPEAETAPAATAETSAADDLLA